MARKPKRRKLEVPEYSADNHEGLAAVPIKTGQTQISGQQLQPVSIQKVGKRWKRKKSGGEDGGGGI